MQEKEDEGFWTKTEMGKMKSNIRKCQNIK